MSDSFPEVLNNCLNNPYVRVGFLFAGVLMMFASLWIGFPLLIEQKKACENCTDVCKYRNCFGDQAFLANGTIAPYGNINYNDSHAARGEEWMQKFVECMNSSGGGSLG